MDPPRRPKGRPRGYSHQVNQPNVNEPRQQIPELLQQGSQIQGPRPQGPRPKYSRPQGPRPLRVPPRPQVPRPRRSDHDQKVIFIFFKCKYLILNTYLYNSVYKVQQITTAM